MSSQTIDPQSERQANEDFTPSRTTGLPNDGRTGLPYLGSDAGSEDLATQLRAYWLTLFKRKELVAGIIVASLALGALWTFMQTPLYTSTVRLQIERNATKVIEGGNVTPVEGSDAEFLKTQFELLQGRSLARRVALTAKLAGDPDYIRPAKFSIFDAPVRAASNAETTNLEQKATDLVLARREVKPVTGTRLVDVHYSDPDPGRAQRVAAAYGTAFIASNLEQRLQANNYAKTFLDDQVKQVKIRLENSEKALVNFAEKEQLVVSGENNTSISENNLDAANRALGTIVSERIKNEQLWKQVEGATAINLPQLLSNKVVEDLRKERNVFVAEYRQKSETFRRDYPAMLQIENKIKTIDRQLGIEVKAIKDSLKGAYEASLNQETQMTERIEALRSDALDVQRRSIRFNILKREVDTTRSLYEGLLQRFKEVDVAGNVGASNIYIADHAELPREKSFPKLWKALAVSLLLGLGTAVGSAVLVERLRDVVDSPQTLEGTFGLPVLGIIPIVARPQTVEAELVNPRSGLAESYRSLCTALQFSTDAGLPKSLFVTSAAPDEGKSTTSVALANFFAATGLKVLLIDADLRNGSLHLKFGMTNGDGLSTYLGGDAPAKALIKQVGETSLYYLSAGPHANNPADLLSGGRLAMLLQSEASSFDIVILDGPPVMAFADAQILASNAAATLFVTSAGSTRVASVRQALKSLGLARAVIIGAVVNRFDSKMHGYGYGEGYGYGYGNRASSEGKA